MSVCYASAYDVSIQLPEGKLTLAIDAAQWTT